jgi:hypothetical protein
MQNEWVTRGHEQWRNNATPAPMCAA